MYKFVISLKRRPERLNQFKNECPYELGGQNSRSLKLVNIVHGFDSRNINQELHDEQLLYKEINLTYPGAIGCFISHLRIYKMIVQNNYPAGIIFEDDSFFTTDFDKKLQRVIRELPRDYHIVYIGGRFTKDYKMKPSSIIKVSDYIVQHNVADWYNHDHDRTTHGYIISNRGAKFLLDRFEKGNIGPRDAIDFWMMNSFMEKDINIYSSNPLLCWSPISGDSDIR